MDELFLAQYNQVWEQRRQHITLIWTIPTVGGAVIAFALSQIPIKELNMFSSHFLFILLLIFSYSVFKIFLRHNAFQQAYGFLLTYLDKEKTPLTPLPQTGEDLFKWGREKGMGFDFWVQKGSEYKGIDSWVIAMSALAASLIILWLDFTNLPTTICPDVFTSLPHKGFISCFSILLAIGLAGLIGFAVAVFLFLKKMHPNGKIILFAVGSLLLVSNAVIMGFKIPNLSLKIQNISDDLSSVEKKITEKAFKMRDYQMWDGQARGTMNSLILMEGLNLKDSAQYQKLGVILIAETSHALYNLAAVSDLNANADLKQIWPKMSIDQLQDEKKKIIDKNPSPFKNLFAQRDELQAEKNLKIKRLADINLFTALAQGIALLLLATSELLFKSEDKKLTSA